MKSSNIRYLPGLDHLRAYAALLIVFYHALQLYSYQLYGVRHDTRPFWILPRKPFAVLVEEGHTAVALFMVLSGFVFTIGCLGREVDYWPFVKNRCLRILPLLTVLLFVAGAAVPAMYTMRGMTQALFFRQYSDGMNVDPFTGMFWAVAVEFQFYLLFPFMHRFLERDGVKWGLGLIAAAMALRLLAVLGGSSNARDISYFHILGRIDQFMLGMIAARVYHRIKERALNWTLLSVLTFGIALATLVTYSVFGGWVSMELWKIAWPTIEGCAWAGFIVAYVGFAQRHAGRWSVPIEQLGSWSYSIYLLHFAVLTCMPRLIPLLASSSPNAAAQTYAWKAVIPVLLPLSALTYYVIERPFLQMRVKYLREP